MLENEGGNKGSLFIRGPCKCERKKHKKGRSQSEGVGKRKELAREGRGRNLEKCTSKKSVQPNSWKKRRNRTQLPIGGR